MPIQTLIVIVVVAWCIVHAAWTLMPNAARASVATLLLRLPLPGLLARRLQKAAAGSGKGCGGCDSCGSTKPADSGVKPITLHRRLRR